jgi:hypothetical protein
VTEKGSTASASQLVVDAALGGAVAYVADHCVSNDDYPVDETSMLQQCATMNWACFGRSVLHGPAAVLALPLRRWLRPNTEDYHAILRLQLGWMVFFGDPTLKLPPLSQSAIES